MNRRQLEVQKSHIQDEKTVLKQLKACYQKASDDCVKKIQELASRTDMENLQSIVYQIQYQKALKKQLDSILDTLQAESFTTLTEYLTKCYDNGYIGAMYDLQGQGIPLILPIDQASVVKALQNDAKLVKPYYDRLGEDVAFLKKAVKAQVSRGIANGSSWFQVAQELANKMVSPFSTALYNSMRIARTEGHRIQQQSQWDALNKAKDKGADIVKQWDSTLDNRTRETHRLLDGQIRELDEQFEVNGHKAKFPGAFGIPEEDIHCRCCMLQRARWAMDEDELHTLEEKAKFFGLDKTADFEEYRKKFLNLPANADKIDVSMSNLEALTDPTLQDLVSRLESTHVQYNQVTMHPQRMTDEDIISAISGGDRTSGSCASVGLAYIGQKGGVNVLDFRDGSSRNFFSTTMNLKELCKLPGVVSYEYNKYSSSVANGVRLLAMCEVGKEYYFVNGRHASIVRKTESGSLQYLELQSAKNSGWTDFGSNVRTGLKWRFSETSNDNWLGRTFMIDVDSFKDSDELKKLLGYINTAESEQRKGVHGTIK